jgi:hypothetical protein
LTALGIKPNAGLGRHKVANQMPTLTERGAQLFLAPYAFCVPAPQGKGKSFLSFQLG